jgi:hypothetical protein
MSKSNLDSYLNDHLAGSVGALELIDHLIHASTDASLRAFFTGLQIDIKADQEVLEGLLRQAQVTQGGVRQAAAWLIDKAAWVKLKIAGTDAGGLGMLQALEALLLGVTGKKALWRSLSYTTLSGDFALLEERADSQIKKLEERRLAAARAALATP